MSTPAEAQQHLGNVYKDTDSTNHAQQAFEGFVESFVTMASQDDWTTIRFALEQYALDQENELESLLKQSPNQMGDRKQGYHEEVALAAELVSKANSALMAFKQARSDYGADV